MNLIRREETRNCKSAWGRDKAPAYKTIGRGFLPRPRFVIFWPSTSHNNIQRSAVRLRQYSYTEIGIGMLSIQIEISEFVKIRSIKLFLVVEYLVVSSSCLIPN